MRAVVAGVVAPALVLVALVGMASPAAAHATLIDSTPRSGEALQAAPDAIVLRFDDAVEIPLGSITVIDSNRRSIKVGKAHHGESSSVVEASLPDLDPGAYAVSWRAVSADSHPISGAFTFTIGSGTADRSLLTDALVAPSNDRPTAIALGIARALVYGALAVLIGVTAFALLWWPEGFTTRRVRVALAGGWVVGLLASIAGIPLQGAYAGGGTLGDVFSGHTWSAVLDTRFGRHWLARVVLLGLLGLVGLMSARQRAPGTRHRRVLLVDAGIVAVALSATVALAGHGGAGEHAAIGAVSTTVHVLAMSLWLGGLVALLLAVASPAHEGVEGADRVAMLRRFSSLALGCVAALLITGGVQSWREMPSFGAFTDSTYGKLLLAKIIIVAVVVAVAYTARRALRAAPARPVAALSAAASDTPVLARVRGSVRLEVVGALVVLGVTAALVATAPPGAGSGVIDVRRVVGDNVIDVVVDPGRAGPTDLHLYVTPLDGSAKTIDEITATLTKTPELKGPLDVDLLRAGPSHFVSNGLFLPFDGKWTLELALRSGEFDQTRTTLEFSIRK